MRFMVIVKGNEKSERGVLPSEEELASMGRFNEELVQAGVMLAGDGLHPTSKGAKIAYSKGGRPRVIDGPFTEAKEIIAGYWILQVRNREEVLEWMKRAPFEEGEIEIRQLYELSDFGDSPAIEKHQELKAQLEGGNR